MNKIFKSFISFTRTERIGLVALSALLIVFIGILVTMPLWVQPATDTEKEKKLVAAWEKFKQSQPVLKDSIGDNNTSLPNIIDLNTADSATLVRLKGIGPVIAGKIVARRKKRGPFTNINELKEVGRFDKATFETLKTHLSIRNAK